MYQSPRPPSSRRKACHRCVSGKRRCDNQAPCTRCARIGLECSLVTTRLRREVDLDQFLATACDPDESDYVFAIDLMPPAAAAPALLTSSEQGVNWPIDVWRVHQLSPPTRIRLPPRYLNTMVQRLQSCVKSLVDDSRTSFMRVVPGQEGYTDTAFDDALAASTVYLSRNRHNRASGNRFLARNYLKLVHNLKSYLRPEEVLSITQAVVVFEIMFLLGDDQQLCDLAVSCTEIVSDAIRTLNEWLITELASPSICATEHFGGNEHDYHRWIKLESVRRTILTYWFLQAAYRHLRDGYCDLVPLLVTLPLTANGDLWKASDERAWSSLAQVEDTSITLLPYLEATDWWISTNYEHMDDFQIMLLETCKTIPARKI